MFENKRTLLIVILAAAALFFSRTTFAAGYGMSIGMNTWFAWWKPFFLESPDSDKKDQSYSIKPGFFYGPSLSFHFPHHINLSSTFFYSQFEAKENYKTLMVFFGTMGASYLPVPSKSSIHVTRYDSDSALIIGVTSFLQFTMGFKYAHYFFSLHELYATEFVNKKKEYDEYSPAIGLNFIIPLVKRQLYLTIGGSVIFSWCTVTQYGTLATLFYYPIIIPLRREQGEFYKIGTNLTTGLAYYVDKAKMTFSLGFRYQMYNLLKTDPTIGKQELTRSFDHFYGITAGVILRVDFSEQKKDMDQDQNRSDQMPEA